MIDKISRYIPEIIMNFLVWVLQDAFHLVSAIGGIVIIWLLIASYKDSREKMNDEYKLTEINKQTEKRGGEETEENKVFLEAKEEVPIEGELYAYILVTNKESQDLTECYANLKEIKLFVDGEWADRKEIINPNYSELTWPDFDSAKEVEIKRNGGEARINIAKTIPNKFAFIFKSGDKPVYITQNHYYLEINVNGKIGQKPIKEKLLKGILHYESRMLTGSGLIQDGRIIDQSPVKHRRLWIEPGELEISTHKGKKKGKPLAHQNLTAFLSDKPHTCSHCGYSWSLLPSDLKDGVTTVIKNPPCPNCGNLDEILRFYP